MLMVQVLLLRIRKCLSVEACWLNDERGSGSLEAIVACLIVAVCVLSVAGGLGSAAHASQAEAGQDTVRDIVSSVGVDQQASAQNDPANGTALTGAAPTSWTVTAPPSSTSAAGTVTVSVGSSGAAVAVTGSAQYGAETVSQSLPASALANP